jgi:NitT/TauT family transport system substrate-binding protein
MIGRQLTRVLVALGVNALVFGSAAQAQTDISFRLDWSLYGVHAPFFLAQQKGYFEEAGLVVSIEEGSGSATVMQLVAQGGDQMALIDYSTMLYGVAEGLPIIAVARVVSDMVGVLSPADAPINSPQELVGKIIAYAPSESSGIALTALLELNNVDRNEISVLNPAMGAKNALFLQGRIDAMPGNVNVQPPQLEAQGAKVHSFKFSDFGLSMMAQGLVANEAFAEANPEAVRGFVAATIKALKDTRDDPAAAVDALIEANPEQERNRVVLLQQLELSLVGLQTANTADKPLGYMDPRDWESMQDVLVTHGGLANPTPVEEIYTNEFLPEQPE